MKRKTEPVVCVRDLARLGKVSDDTVKQVIIDSNVTHVGERSLGRGWQYDYKLTDLEKGGFWTKLQARRETAGQRPKKAGKKATIASLQADVESLRALLEQANQPRGPGARFGT